MATKLVKFCLVDTFTEKAFKGNPSAVCLLENDDHEDEWLQNVAREFNQAVTSYLTRLTESNNDNENSAAAAAIPKFRLRWFSRDGEEISICGHSTLASSHFLLANVMPDTDTIEFSTLSGTLIVRRLPDTSSPGSFSIELDFPILPLEEYDNDEISTVSKILNGAPVVELKRTTVENYILVVLTSGEAVEEIEPQIDAIRRYPARGIIVTGPAPSGSGFDFYTRFFCPNLGADEDHVCGSAHCALSLYWCQRLGKQDYVAYQASRRSGVIKARLDEKNQRVFIQGKAVAVMEGSILV